MEYQLTDKKLRQLKAAVTRARNKKDWQEVIYKCDQALNTFNVLGYPDCWSDFERHRYDAQMAILYRREV
jgi:tricorn protease-like protein